MGPDSLRIIRPFFIFIIDIFKNSDNSMIDIDRSYCLCNLGITTNSKKTVYEIRFCIFDNYYGFYWMRG
jgi:hypothetical protein